MLLNVNNDFLFSVNEEKLEEKKKDKKEEQKVLKRIENRRE